jgi:hypothetical protein
MRAFVHDHFLGSGFSRAGRTRSGSAGRPRLTAHPRSDYTRALLAAAFELKATDRASDAPPRSVGEIEVEVGARP